MNAVLTEWEVIKTSRDFNCYLKELIDFCPNFFQQEFITILQSFLNLEELVATQDPYHRHGIISAHFIMRLIKSFPAYQLTDAEIFELLVAGLIHDCEIDELNEKVMKYSFVHCNKRAFDYIFRATGLQTNSISNIIELVNETIYDESNSWLAYDEGLKAFVLGPRTKDLIDRTPKLSKKTLKILAVIFADIVGQMAPSGYRKMVEKYIFRCNPDVDKDVPRSFLELYDFMEKYWDKKLMMDVSELERFKRYRKIVDEKVGVEVGD